MDIRFWYQRFLYKTQSLGILSLKIGLFLYAICSVGLLLVKPSGPNGGATTPITKYSQEYAVMTEVLLRDRGFIDEFTYTMGLQRRSDTMAALWYWNSYGDEIRTASIEETLVISNLVLSENKAVQEAISAARENNIISVAEADRIVDAWKFEFMAGRISKNDKSKPMMTGFMASKSELAIY